MLVDGGWSEWTVPDECTVTCGGGTQTMSRQCNSPEPQNGGAECTGSYLEELICQIQLCLGNSLSIVINIWLVTAMVFAYFPKNADYRKTNSVMLPCLLFAKKLTPVQLYLASESSLLITSLKYSKDYR